MKIGDVIEIIYNKEGYDSIKIGDIGVIKYPFGDYCWVVDIINPSTKQILSGEVLKEEQMRVLELMPAKIKVYSLEEIQAFEKIYKEKESELRNFKEYDLLEIIRDREEYSQEGFGIGDMGIVSNNVEHRGRIHMLARDMEEYEDTELSVRREDVRVVDRWYKDSPKKYNEKERQEFFEWSKEREKFFKQKDEERRKKYGY